MDSEPLASGAIRLARVAYPWNGSRCNPAPAARTDLDRVPMTARTAGTGDRDLDRSRNTPAPPQRWLSPPRRAPADGNGDVLDEQVLTTPSTASHTHGAAHPRHHSPTAPHPRTAPTHQGALNDDELTRRLRDVKPTGTN
jgi:hypothetical protein